MDLPRYLLRLAGWSGGPGWWAGLAGWFAMLHNGEERTHCRHAALDPGFGHSYPLAHGSYLLGTCAVEPTSCMEGTQPRIVLLPWTEGPGQYSTVQFMALSNGVLIVAGEFPYDGCYWMFSRYHH